MQLAVVIRTSDLLRAYEEVPKRTTRAAVQALNKTADRSRTRGARAIRQQINFPASYLDPNAQRLFVAERATEKSLVSVVRARTRATSLARFLTSSGKDGLRVSVHPGRTITLKRAFVVRLRAGSQTIDTKSNLGIAVRTKDGQRPSKAYKPVRLGKDTWLLYGPSVDQAFKSVREDIRPDAEVELSAEFQRLIGLDL